MLWKKEKNIWENLTNIFQKPPPSWVIVITQNPSNIIQFSSIQSHSCPTHCDPMDRSLPGLHFPGLCINGIVYTLICLGLASSQPWHRKTHPCGSVSVTQGRVHRVDGRPFVCLRQCTCGLLPPLAVTDEAVLSVCAQVSVWTGAFMSLRTAGRRMAGSSGQRIFNSDNLPLCLPKVGPLCTPIGRVRF